MVSIVPVGMAARMRGVVVLPVMGAVGVVVMSWVGAVARAIVVVQSVWVVIPFFLGYERAMFRGTLLPPLSCIGTERVLAARSLTMLRAALAEIVFLR